MMLPKVLMVSCDNFANGGVQNVIMNIVRNMSHKYQFDVLLFSKEKTYHEDEFINYGKIHRIPCKERRIDYYLRFFKIFRRTYKILKNENYDIIHCHKVRESAACILAAKLAKVPIRISHIHVNDNFKANIIRKIYDKFYVFLLNRFCTNKLACSKIAGESVFGENSNFEVIVNPIDLKKFDYNKYEHNDAKDINFIHVGSFSDNKNQEFLLDVFYEIKHTISNVKLDLIGFGDEYKNKLGQKIKSLGLDDCVKILPHDSNVPEYLAKSDYMIFPSKREGLGIALLEAQAMGVRCFVSSYVPPEANAGLCEFYDLESGHKEWAKDIIEYIKNNPERNFADMSNFNIENICKKYDNIYSMGGNIN